VTTTLGQAYAAAREVAHASGSTFYAGMRLLPPPRRDGLFAVYAIARKIDDIADGDLPRDAKLAALDSMRAELRSIGASDDPLLVALADTARRFPVPLEAFDDLLDGAEADARGTRYDQFADLERYCRCVAGSIGRLCLGLFEPRDPVSAAALADDLGVALQLANILRDVVDDLHRGRVYLPAADLERFGCRVEGGRIAGDAELLIAFEAERALGWLRRGLELVPLLDRSSARCVLAMTAAYERLVERIAAHPELALRARVSLGSWEKRALVARSLVRRAA
jgi:15-cis-phytoene synthase